MTVDRDDIPKSMTAPAAMPSFGLPESAASSPSSESLVAACRSLGTRLAEDLRNLIEGIPDRSKSVRGLAAYLSLDTGHCQRMLAASRCVNDPLEAVCRAPGIEGLRTIIERARSSGVPTERVEALLATSMQFERLVTQAGSHSRLKRVLESPGSHDPSQEDRERTSRTERLQLYRLTAKHIGASMERRVAMFAAIDDPETPGRISTTSLSAHLGFQSVPGSSCPSPLVIEYLSRYADMDRSDRDTDPLLGKAQSDEGDVPGGMVPPPPLTYEVRLVPSLSSTGSLAVINRPQQSSRITVVDADQGQRWQDVTTIHRLPSTPHPLTEPSHRDLHCVRVRYPIKELILEAWLHRSIASLCTASVAAIWPSGHFYANGSVQWHERLVMPGRLEIMQGAEPPPPCGWKHHARATDYLFTRSGWSRKNFVGFRTIVPYPLWGMLYAIQYDFAAPED